MPGPYWIDWDVAGRLAISPRPLGGAEVGPSMAAWRAARVDLVVRLLDEAEVHELRLTRQQEACDQADIRFLSFPIADRGVPTNAVSAVALARGLADEVRAGVSVLIHCRAGIGRSALLAASVLVSDGIAVEEAFHRIRAARRVTVPDTPEQSAWVLDHADLLSDASSPALS